MPEAHSRINAAIRFLRLRDIHRIVLVGHGCSVHMSMSYFKKSPIRDFDAFIGIGMGATDEKQPAFQPWPLATLDFPVLDIYGSEEFSARPDRVEQRLKAIQLAGNSHSQQIAIANGDHMFQTDGTYQVLLGAIVDWLKGLSS